MVTLFIIFHILSVILIYLDDSKNSLKGKFVKWVMNIDQQTYPYVTVLLYFMFAIAPIFFASLIVIAQLGIELYEILSKKLD
jgi:hypothetical protein